MLAIAYAFFIPLIGGEAAVSLWRKDGHYRLGEAVVNIGHGVVYQVFDNLTKGLIILPFLALSALVTWPQLPMDAWWGWLLGLLLYDLATYWLHRHHHEIHFLWAIHGVHHAAEDFNFAAALRQAIFQNVFGWLWRLPLALLLPLEMFVAVIVFDFLYQFLQHTRYVPKLGPIEWVMNTPSHHRVHHGTEEKYLDKNYGGIFIIWDRLFGTFQVEEEEPTYGLTRPIGSLNAVWGNLAIYSQLARASKRVQGWTKATVWLSGPGELSRLCPDDGWTAPPAFSDGSTPLRIRAYVLLTSAAISPTLGWMLLTGSTWSSTSTLTVSLLVVLSVVQAGALLEQRPWAVPVEILRLLMVSAVVCVWLGALWPAAIGVVTLATLALAQLGAIESRLQVAD
jgi:sterol desaturase/sphingolipid hydroxylase (fatty acid hydroxylase superfamily)